MRKLLKLLLILVLAVPLYACGQKAALTEDLYIFFTSDVHCSYAENFGFPALRALIDDTRAEHHNVALVDLGDYIQGGTAGAFTRGEMIIRLMNRMGYDAAAIGNHEFDYGIQRLKELADMAEFPLTACNIRYTGSGENGLKDVAEYVMKEYDGVKVAFIGVTTPNAITSSTPAAFQENGEFVYDLYREEDGLALAAKVQETVDRARTEGAQYVILLCHMGSKPEYSPYDAVSLIHNTNGIDAVLDGHAHTAVIGDPYPNRDGEDVILSSPGMKLENVGELIIGKDGTISTVLFGAYDREDEEMKNYIAQAEAELDEKLNVKVGESAFDLSVTDENGFRLVRNRETAIGNFIADVYREALQTDVYLINGGAIRDSFHAGDITFRDVLAVQPFMNTLSSARVSGQQILDALEFGARKTESIIVFDEKEAGESGAFMQVSGLKYTIDTSVPSSVEIDENGLMSGIAGERRVKDVYILENGEYVPLDPEKTYLVGGADYVIEHDGDGNTAFRGGEVIVSGGMTDSDILSDWFRAHGTIPESYRETEGRITVK